MKMNYFQHKKNEEIGEKIRIAREKQKLTQHDIQAQIDTFYMSIYENHLKEYGFSDTDIDAYFDTDFDKLDLSLKKRIKAIGTIDAPPSRIALSTISNYENGNRPIPTWYVELMKKFLGDLHI